MKDSQRKLLDLLDSYGPYLHGLLAKLTLRSDVAEELMQELFIRLGCKPLRRVANLQAYARRVAINLAFDWRRKNKRRLLSLERNFRRTCGDELPLDKLINEEQLDIVLNALGQLDSTKRYVLITHYIQQQSYDDIAIQLDKTPHQVRAICAKGISQLRQMLNSKLSIASAKEFYNAERK